MDDFNKALDELVRNPDKSKIWLEQVNKKIQLYDRFSAKITQEINKASSSNNSHFAQTEFLGFCESVRSLDLDVWLVEGELLHYDCKVACKLILTGCASGNRRTDLLEMWAKVFNLGPDYVKIIKDQVLGVVRTLRGLCQHIPPIPMVTQKELYEAIGVSRGVFRGQLKRNEWTSKPPVSKSDRSIRIKNSQKRFWTHQDFEYQRAALDKYRKKYGFNVK